MVCWIAADAGRSALPHARERSRRPSTAGGHGKRRKRIVTWHLELPDRLDARYLLADSVGSSHREELLATNAPGVAPAPPGNTTCNGKWDCAG